MEGEQAAPVRVYVGGVTDYEVGGEIGNPEHLYIATDKTTITADRDLKVPVRVVLHSGTLAMGSKAKVLETLIVAVHNTGNLDVGSSTFEVDARIVYNGNERRSAGAFWPVCGVYVGSRRRLLIRMQASGISVYFRTVVKMWVWRWC